MRKRLDEIANVTKLAGFEFTKHMKYLDDGEIIAIRALNLKNGCLELDDVKRIARDVSEALPRSQLHKFDIVLSYTGTIGEAAQILEENKYHLAPNVAKVEPIVDLVDPRYLFHYIRSREFQLQMIAYAHGSTQPTVPMSTIRELTVPIFDIKTEKEIARVLDSLDSKIAVNKRINQNLLQQALSLFERVFVTQDHNADELPLYGFADFINGAAFKPDELGDVGLPVIKIGELKNGITDSTRYFSGDKGVKNLVFNKDILFSWSGNPETSIDLFIWSDGDGILNQHTFNVKSKFNCPWFTYLLLKYHKPLFTYIASNKQTTGLGHVTVADLKRLTFPFDPERMKEFEAFITPLMDLLYGNLLENNKLSDVRDTILPKLIQGELDVSALCI